MRRMEPVHQEAAPETEHTTVDKPAADTVEHHSKLTKANEFEVSLSVEMQEFSDTDSKFHATGWVNVSWKQPGLTKTELKWDDVKDLCPIPPGAVLFSNALRTTADPEHPSVEIEQDRVKVVFGYDTEIGCPLALHRFPFDRQSLKICVANYWDNKDLKWTVMKPAAFSLLGNLTDMWEMRTPQFGFVESDGIAAPVMIIHLERKSSYYMYNVVLPLFFIVSIMLASFTLPITDLADRLSIVLTLLLTSVAFNYIVSAWLPKKSYLTLLHKYVLLGFFLLFLTATENTIIFLLDSWNGSASDVDSMNRHDTYNFADAIIGVVMAVFWFSLHLLIPLLSMFGLFHESWKSVHSRTVADDSQDFVYTKDVAGKPLADLSTIHKRKKKHTEVELS